MKVNTTAESGSHTSAPPPTSLDVTTGASTASFLAESSAATSSIPRDAPHLCFADSEFNVFTFPKDSRHYDSSESLNTKEMLPQDVARDSLPTELESQQANSSELSLNNSSYNTAYEATRGFREPSQTSCAQAASTSAPREPSHNASAHTASCDQPEGIRLNAEALKSSSQQNEIFECNICFDTVAEPVVTRCGHLFCWECLNAWLASGVYECPVCKAGVTEETIIPLYGRGQDSSTRKKASTRSRPRAERLEPPPPRRDSSLIGGLRFSFELFGLGMGASFDAMDSRGVRFAPADFRRTRPGAQPDEDPRMQLISPILLFLGLLLTFYLLLM